MAMFDFFRGRASRRAAADSPQSQFPPADPADPADAAEVALIRACRERLGAPPRSLNATDREALRLTLSSRLRAAFEKDGDPLLSILAGQEALRDRGQVVWGHLIQANNSLFDPANQETLPANLIYSLDPYFDGHLSVLNTLARGLYALKGSVPEDPELREFVRVITDEYERVVRKELPRRLCGGRSVHFAICLIQPGHLPGNALKGPDFPLLVNFREVEGVMLLPSRFWPNELVSQWG